MGGSPSSFEAKRGDYKSFTVKNTCRLRNVNKDTELDGIFEMTQEWEEEYVRMREYHIK
jgi:hypothetical protein